MAPLLPDLRKQLEKAIIKAREVAELGAKKALESLAVHHHEPHGSMTPEQRKLRNRLRAHGRQLGDARNAQGGQEVRRLLREVAYEHWHRMLFARFLSENDLLIEPSNRVSVSLGDVEDLARERGVDPWSMAASFAQRMLPQIFRQDDPVLQVALPPETRQALEALVVGLPSAVFTAEDALGWTYQFWQSAEKDAVNARVKSGEKISGETLPAVTQLFTEHYMVQFLLHNTLGAWHAGKLLAAQPDLAREAKDEAELRAAAALSGYEFDYLRFVREGEDGPWRPAAGVFAAWPKSAKELRVLDPCCGSGHFLVAGLELLVALRQHEEGLSVSDAVTAVLRDNLFGLELDARCTQIAAFALAMAAWKRVGSPNELPTLQVACCGIGPSGTKEQWLKLAEQAAAQGGMPVKRGLFSKEESLLSVPIRNALEDLYLLFQKAPELGSLIDPKATAAGLYQASYEDVQPLLERVLHSESAGEDAQEQAVAAQGMAKAAVILGQTFTLVVTNVPYRKAGDLEPVLKKFIDDNYPEAKAALESVFVSRILKWLGTSGTAAMVTPQSWLFLGSYKRLRKILLEKRSWHMVARLGPRAFETIGGEIVNVALIQISAGAMPDAHQMAGIEVSAAKTPTQKAALLRGEVPARSDEAAAAGFADGDAAEKPEGDDDAPLIGPADGIVRLMPQAEQLKNPDARIVLSCSSQVGLLSDLAGSFVGLQNNDSPKNLAQFWELPSLGGRWALFQLTADRPSPIAGRTGIVRWPAQPEYLIKGTEAWSKVGVLIRHMGDLVPTLYHGDLYDQSSAAVVPSDPVHLPAIWCFCSSPD
ncbi:MAG: N-6 DNA methylase, partial [Planctomycetota bacterium]|nr:N-6 DNA methylase [Planctomycetota bacterium]